MKILFVSGTRRHARPYFDPATRYRCFHLATELNRAGIKAICASQEEFERHMGASANFDAYIFHRPSMANKLGKFVCEYKTKRLLIADYDDLLFDPAVARQISTVKKDHFSLSGALRQSCHIAAAASIFDNFSLSTQPLKEHVERLFQPRKAVVIHNGLPASFLGLCAAARKKYPWKGRRYLFGYMSGTATHDRDFLFIKKLILGKLQKSGQKLLLAGPLDKNDREIDACGFIERHGLVSFSTLPELMAQCKYLLAPLEDNIFNLCKSGIKFMEGAACGCVVIATPIPDMDRFESPLLVKCRAMADWQKAIGEAGDAEPDTEAALARLRPLINARASARNFVDSFLNSGGC